MNPPSGPRLLHIPLTGVFVAIGVAELIEIGVEVADGEVGDTVFVVSPQPAEAARNKVIIKNTIL